MSVKKKRKTDLNSLVNRYKRVSVVSEIEKNLVGNTIISLSPDELILSDLYSEKNYNLDIYTSLEKSIREDGFLMPLIAVKNEGGNYEIINGVKRFLLGKKIGLKTIPIVKAELAKERKFQYILENIQSEGDSAFVKTYAFTVLKEKYKYNDSDIADLSSLSLAQVRNILRLNNLPQFLKDALLDFTLTYAEARSLLNLPLDRQKELYDGIRKGEFSVRELEKVKRRYTGKSKENKVIRNKNKITITFKSEEEAIKNYDKLVRDFKD